MAVQLQAQSLLRAPAGRPALRSVFCALPLSVRMPAPTRATFWEAARITMRFGGVASKQAYICRDCGYIYKDRTPFEKLSDDYYCPDASTGDYQEEEVFYQEEEEENFDHPTNQDYEEEYQNPEEGQQDVYDN